MRLCGDYIPPPKKTALLKSKLEQNVQPNEGDQQSVAEIEDVSYDDMSGPRKPSVGFDGISALNPDNSGP